jgi:hypothetical protein
MLVDPIRAGDRTGKAGLNAVAGTVDAIRRVKIDFCHNASHINALEICGTCQYDFFLFSMLFISVLTANTTAFTMWNTQVGELVHSDITLTYGPIIAIAAIFENVILVV